MAVISELNITSNLEARENNLTKFNYFFPNKFYDPFTKGYSFIFMTKPSLFLYPSNPVSSGNSITANDKNELKALAFDNMKRDSLFSQFILDSSTSTIDNIIIKQLSFIDFTDIQTKFLPCFTNLCKNFETQDTNMESIDSYETKEGYRISLPTVKTMSEAAGQFSLLLDENIGADILKMISLWVNYISNISDGTFSANPEAVKGRFLDYTSSLYYFSLAPDGKTIRYWAKYTGCWPSNIPYGSFSFSKGATDAIEHTINFYYTIKEDMKPEILEDFNMISLNIENQNSSFLENESADYFSPLNSILLNEELLKNRFSQELENNIINPVIVFRKSSDSSNTRTGSYQFIFPIDNSFQKERTGFSSNTNEYGFTESDIDRYFYNYNGSESFFS